MLQQTSRREARDDFHLRKSPRRTCCEFGSHRDEQENQIQFRLSANFHRLVERDRQNQIRPSRRAKKDASRLAERQIRNEDRWSFSFRAP